MVIGDICLDIMEEGISQRISPEAPVPVILNPITTHSLGMAGNVALNLKNLGANVSYYGVYVKDAEGEIITQLLKENGLIKKTTIEETKHNNLSTISKKRILANGSQVARIDVEKPYPTDEVTRMLVETLNISIDNGEYYDLIVIADYDKYTITSESWNEIYPLLLQLSENFYVDTKKLNVISFYEGMQIFPNRDEMEKILRFNGLTKRNELRIELDLPFIIETASEEGAWMYKDDGKIINAPVYKANVIDICGAGDTFIAAFSLYYTKFQNKIRALEFANYCCSKVVQKKGTQPVELHEVLDYAKVGDK
jgi:rfaE bifunctional protein kinase chain/domain